jgi:hypothetical protein
METGLIARIRSNYTLLLFLVVTVILLGLWWLFMLLVSFGGTLFDDPSEVGMSIFMVFFFPLIAAPIVSGLSLLITRLLNMGYLGCLIILSLGVVIPLVAIALVFVGHLITKKLYTGDLESIPEFMPKSIQKEPVATLEPVKAISVEMSAEPADKLAKLKDMLDKGLISQQDYETKKAEILAKI